MKLFSLFKKNYYPLNKISISKSRLLYNYAYLSSISTDLKVAPVLKSNAYGHGLKHIAGIIDTENPPFICVDSLYEAYELLKIKVKSPILIMGFVHPENLKVKKLPFSYAIYSKEAALAVNRYQSHAKVHLFVDTGMHREGINLEELPEFLDYLKSLNNIKIEGLMSHLGESEKPKKQNTLNQVKNFNSALNIMNSKNIYPKWVHLGNSSAILNFKSYKGRIGNIARSGIALYGIDPENKDKNLKPVMELKSYLNQVKKIQKGEKIGYSFTYTVSKNMTIGILPLGYNDGIDRRLSNTGCVRINDIYCPIIGRISMNLTTIDISEIKDPETGMEVVVYSRNTQDKNSIYNLSRISTIPYEQLVNLTPSTRREVTN